MDAAATQVAAQAVSNTGNNLIEGGGAAALMIAIKELAVKFMFRNGHAKATKSDVHLIIEKKLQERN